MNCMVFSTSRLIREYIATEYDRVLPKLYTVEEFIRRIVVVENRSFVDENIRVHYLYRAIGKLDISSLGFEKGFQSFLKNSLFVFRFFEEIFAEQVQIETLREMDTYSDFNDHLDILEKIYDNYAEELEKDGLIDFITIEKYRINEKFLKQFSRIDIHVDGYLSRFEKGVLDRIETPLFVHFVTTPFNKKLIEIIGPKERIETGVHTVLEWRGKRVTEKSPIAPFDPKRVKVVAFDERIDQVAFVLKTVEEFVEEGADPDRIAVILPDESFSDYLKLFDREKNFNYAMGTPFVQSVYYRMLADLYDALSDRNEIAKEKAKRNGLLEKFETVTDFASFMTFLESLPLASHEHKAIDESRYFFTKFGSLVENESPLNLLHSWLQILQKLRIDDVGGGRITVMGVLESRGKSFDGVVIVDFNEERVPKVGEKDLFLNSFIRRHAKMPTRSDKENLQKNYYYLLLSRSRRAAISYVKSEEVRPSRFLRELGLKDVDVASHLYRPIIAPVCKTPDLYDDIPESVNTFRSDRRLTPTKLKDFLVCRRRFYYKYILKIGSEDREEKNFGLLIHASLEAAARNKEAIFSADEYYHFIMDHIYKNITKMAQRFEFSIEWEDRLKKFCMLDFDKFFHMSQPVVEEWCSVEFEGFLLSSKIDRVDLSANKVRIMDYKTTRNIKNLLEDENDFQLLFYKIWAESAYPDKMAETLYFDLFGSKEIPVETTQKRDLFKKVLDSLLETDTIKFEKTQEESECRYCDYKIACGRG